MKRPSFLLSQSQHFVQLPRDLVDLALHVTLHEYVVVGHRRLALLVELEPVVLAVVGKHHHHDGLGLAFLLLLGFICVLLIKENYIIKPLNKVN